jgi:hypothetical protein
MEVRLLHQRGEGKPGEVELYTCGREGSSTADV